MIETVRDDVGHPGAYEGLGAFEVWLVKLVNEHYGGDEETGSTDYGAWMARAGRFLVSTDDRGFWYVQKCVNIAEAMHLFDQYDLDYNDWMMEDDEMEDDE